MTSTLVLYDTTNTWGYLGELYAIGGANLSSHFGTWTAKPVVNYAAGELNTYTAVLYFGSTYNEPIPPAFLADVQATSVPVIWCSDNIWLMAGSNFTTRYGWDPGNSFFTATGSPPGDGFTVGTVQYKANNLTRFASNSSGILNPTILDPAKVVVLGTAVRSDGFQFPWAIRSSNLTYIGEIPFSFMAEEDRVLAYADLLFDALAPATPTRHRALVRLEDLDPLSDPVRLRGAADYLFSKGIPFGFGVSPFYRDPLGVDNNGVPQFVHLGDQPPVASALRYLQTKGGTIVDHGYTHQWDGAINPYNEVTGDDFEFFRVTENPDHSLNYLGPIPGDSVTWASGRISSANTEFAAAGLGAPRLFEFPHYAGSEADYRAVASFILHGNQRQFPTRWERSLYFGGLLSGGPINYAHIFGQFFPYVVQDVYGTKVLPENLGSISLTPFFNFPTRFPADIVNAAQKNLVVRDGFAAFYYHPDFVDLTYLQQTVEGILSLGYTFVNPTSL